VALASRGSRKFGEMEEKIEDDAELRQVKRQAFKVQVKASIAGLVLTALAFLIP
jgi:hypothetical protein